MFNIIPSNTQIDFVGKRNLWMGISILSFVVTVVLYFTKGINYGIDFAGGTEVQVRISEQAQSYDVGRLRDLLEKGGLEGPRVQSLGEAGRGEYLIRTQNDKDVRSVGEKIKEIFKTKLGEGGFTILKEDVVGPAAGSMLRKKGFLALFYVLFAILIYVSIRFDSRYAPGAVLALFHDSVICLGVFMLTGKQFDLTVLAAILALIGYSNNDTIIVYDRVRETLHMHPNLTVEQAVNRAINETLGRTIVTALSTFLVVFALWIWGGSVIENFAFAFLIGLVVGTYSSIFIASSVIIYITQYRKNRDTRMKQKGVKPKRRYDVRPEPFGH